MNNYLKTLELKNFQKHSDLILQFTPDINIIYGESGTGKSCIVRALRWLYYNEPKGDVVRKEGSKITSVTATLSNGIRITRTKSATKNSYTIEVNGESKEYHAIGTTIPQEVAEILEADTLMVDDERMIANISKQLDKQFLLDKPGSFKVKLLNKIVGNDILDEVFKSLNKDLLNVKKEETFTDEQINLKTESLNQTKEKQALAIEQYNKYVTLLTALKSKIEQYENLSQLYTNITKLNNELEKIDLILNNNVIVDDQIIDALKNKIDELLIYKTYQSDITRIETKLMEIIEPKLTEIPITIIDKIEIFENLKKINTDLNNLNNKIDNLDSILKCLQAEIDAKVEEYKKALQLYGKCPTCETQITKDILDGIHL